MRKIIFLFYCVFFCFIQAEANESQLKIIFTIQFKKQSLDSALCQLERQSGFQFVYQDRISGKLAKVNKKFEDKTLSQILDVLLANTDNTYAIVARWVVLYKKPENSSKPLTNQQFESFSIIGTVVDDEDGQGLYPVSISIKGEKVENTMTNRDGSFIITTTNPNTEIIIAYPAYIPRVMHIKDVGLIKLERDPVLWKKVIRDGPPPML